MATPFAAIESRLNAAAQSRLANAQASINSAPAVAGMFDRKSADALSYVTGVRVSFQAPESLLGTVLEGDAISVTTDTGTALFNGEVSRIEQDGGGWVCLYLQEAN